MRRVFVCLLVLIALPGLARAATPHVGFQFGYNTYAMERANEVLDIIGDQMTSPAPDRLDSGSQIGASFGLTFADGFQAELAYLRLNASTEASSPEGTLDLSTPGHVLMLRGLLPVSGDEKIQPQLGLGVGLISAGGTLRHSGGNGASYALSGRSFYLEATLGVNFAVSRTAHIELAAGYRHAEVRDVLPSAADEDPLDYGNLDVDYSGLTARLGVRLQLTKND